MTVMTNATEISARLNSTYRCVSSSTVSLSAEVNLTFSDVRMEAYMRGANLSTDESVCSADQTVTTTAPTQSPRTTAAPSPVPLPAPERGNYTLTNRNGTACLLALMGLQLNVTHRSKSLNQMVSEVVNLQPNRTTASGSCGFTVATLVLTEDLTNLTFTFTLRLCSGHVHQDSVTEGPVISVQLQGPEAPESGQFLLDLFPGDAHFPPARMVSQRVSHSSENHRSLELFHEGAGDPTASDRAPEGPEDTVRVCEPSPLFTPAWLHHLNSLQTLSAALCVAALSCDQVSPKKATAVAPG
ncbi:lysosome-associated membrane glycoprotein 1-like [Sinocyclocheilus grahami]|uniref:lysosome-associated membrane glycoprotein 1-like n=1 Tax=Sinocyclocheilus grahami TaxID=75366 RepID=UPI0007ACE3A9|nr:PREDICTED: lysosome-associated membrane glycoprotein 1-like [Sinocyclocheilus grahami]